MALFGNSCPWVSCHHVLLTLRSKLNGCDKIYQSNEASTRIVAAPATLQIYPSVSLIIIRRLSDFCLVSKFTEHFDTLQLTEPFIGLLTFGNVECWRHFGLAQYNQRKRFRHSHCRYDDLKNLSEEVFPRSDWVAL